MVKEHQDNLRKCETERPQNLCEMKIIRYIIIVAKEGVHIALTDNLIKHPGSEQKPIWFPVLSRNSRVLMKT